ncbi:MAG: hypothetical protein ACYDCG_09060 [Candidatus Acidiferrales bacterium]
MLIRLHGRKLPPRARLLGGVCVMVCVAVFVATARTPDQPADDAVGVIEGEDISVTGPMSVEVVGGQTKTILRSGSDVRVNSGQARISLVEGGQISICGPAHLSVLKSGGALTVALESGAIHARLEGDLALSVYTAQIQAQTVAIGDDPREILVGFENPGLMCIRTYRGAMRLEQQLSGQSVMVPQGEDVMLANGQIETLGNGVGHCKCELQIAKAPVVPAVAPAVNAAPATNKDTTSSEVVANPGEEATASEKPVQKTEPIYTVDMPPLRFDASAKVQPEPDARLMVIVRRVRVRPTLIFQGRVEGEVVAAAAAAPQQAPAASAPAAAPVSPPQGSVIDRVRSFFRKLWTRGG